MVFFLLVLYAYSSSDVLWSEDNRISYGVGADDDVGGCGCGGGLVVIDDENNDDTTIEMVFVIFITLEVSKTLVLKLLLFT